MEINKENELIIETVANDNFNKIFIPVDDGKYLMPIVSNYYIVKKSNKVSSMVSSKL